MTVRTPYVAVVGPGIASPDEDAMAEEVGRFLARRGAVVLSGGMTGAMEAASRGAKAEGGMTIGILPGTSRTDGNPYLDVAIPTGLGEIRNTLVVRAADVVIAIAGEFGTLSEIAFALKIGTPVIGLRTWELGKSGEPVEAFEIARTPAGAVEAAARLWARPGTNSS